MLHISRNNIEYKYVKITSKTTEGLNTSHLSLLEAVFQTLTLEGKEKFESGSIPRGASGASTHGQCLSTHCRHSVSIFAKLSLSVCLCGAVCVWFLYPEVSEVRS